MVSLGQFAKRIRERGRRVPENVNQVIIKAAGTILQRVVVATPVDTGRARGGWLVGIDNSPRTLGGLDKGGGATIGRGRAVLAGRRPEQTIYISNNVNYIVYLDQGSSAQAPANFVAQAVNAGIAGLDGRGITR